MMKNGKKSLPAEQNRLHEEQDRLQDEHTRRKTEKERQFSDGGEGGGHIGRLRKRDNLPGVALEPKYTIARKLGHLEIIQSSLHITCMSVKFRMLLILLSKMAGSGW
jgi:hypothetical protein